jgi:hypothetical protein
MKTFDQYLNSLPRAEASALRRAEQAWLRYKRPAANDQADPLMRDFEESMCGYATHPAGPRRG